MLDVDVEKILPVTEVRDSLNKIIDEVEGSDELYVVTKNGKPSAVVVGVQHLEKLTGVDHKQLLPDDDLSPTKTDDKPIDNFASTTEAAVSSTSTASPSSPITPLSGDLSKDDTYTPTPIDTAVNEDVSSSQTPPPTPSNNGALASPLGSSPLAQTDTAAPAPNPIAPPMPSSAPIAPVDQSPAPVATPAPAPTPTTDAAAEIDDADDIFGPDEDEAETAPVTPAPASSSATGTAAPLSTPAPTSTIPPTPPTTNNTGTTGQV